MRQNYIILSFNSIHDTGLLENIFCTVVIFLCKVDLYSCLFILTVSQIKEVSLTPDKDFY